MSQTTLQSQFIQAALSNLRQAQEILAKHPETADADFHSALVLGDVGRVKKELQESLEKATAKGGPLNADPLIYVCFSRFATGKGTHPSDFAALARLLLEHGADPNTAYNDPLWPDNPLPCLYAATGLNNNLELATVLLDAGANPNDGESLYHSTEHPDLQCMKLLLERGAKPTNGNILKHMLDYEAVEGVRLLLAAGADPNEVNERRETALHWAVKRGRSATVLAALVRAGVNVDARRNDGRTAFAMAKMSGQAEAVMALHRSGANMEISPIDSLLGVCALAEESGIPLLIASARPQMPLPAEYQNLLVEFAANHDVGAVRGLLAMGVPVDSRGEHGGTALHWACWKGYPDLVTLLLAHGASTDIKDNSYQATAAGWFQHGRENTQGSDEHYAALETILRQKGLL